jgi:uracil-DNA glycosylase
MKNELDIDWNELNEEIISCRRCPRLVEWRERIGQEKRKQFSNDNYWAKAVPNFGDPNADLLIVGLAPAAHGANRTGRMFTGDRSGDWLYAALHRAGLANQPTSISADDGLRLHRVMITATCHCAPPDNKPTPEEIRNCDPFLRRTLAAKRWTGILCLGKIGWDQTCRSLMAMSDQKDPLPKFGHAVQAQVAGFRLVGSYHPSQQNTFTGRLTEAMLDEAIRIWQVGQ